MQYPTSQVRTIEHLRWSSADKIMSITAYSVNDTINKFGDFGCGYYFTKSYEQAERDGLSVQGDVWSNTV